MTTKTWPASQKQIDFLKDLLATREVQADMNDTIVDYIDTDTLSGQLASALIDTLLKLPRSAKRSGPPSATQLALADLPRSRYAIHVDYIDCLPVGHTVSGDYLFVEVKEWMGTVYMRRLQGSVGSFVRVKMEASDVLDLAKIIEANPYLFARQFGEVYACCGKCGAELTDPKSRELFLGPTCRTSFTY